MHTIAIIIVHYNTPQDTRECLESLSDLDVNGFKSIIVVVDNGSQELLQLPKSVTDRNTEVIRSESNLGYTGGNNLGITYAREKYEPDYFLLLNSDTVVDPQLLSELYKRATSEKKIGLVSPQIYFAPGYEYHKESYTIAQRGKVLWYAGGSIDWTSLSTFHRGVDELDTGQFDSQRESEYATGCCVLIPRVVFETVGLLDKRFFLYFEDVDYSLRAKEAGFPLYFESSAILWHKNAGSSGGAGGNVSEYYQTRNQFLFALLHAPFRIKITALRVALSTLLHTNKYKQKAAIDFLLQRYGKQPII